MFEDVLQHFFVILLFPLETEIFQMSLTILLSDALGFRKASIEWRELFLFFYWCSREIFNSPTWTWFIIMAENTTNLFELSFDGINATKKKDLVIENEKLKGKVVVDANIKNLCDQVPQKISRNSWIRMKNLVVTLSLWKRFILCLKSQASKRGAVQ